MRFWMTFSNVVVAAAGVMLISFSLYCSTRENNSVWLAGYYVSTDLRFGVQHRPMGDVEASTTGSLMCMDSLGNFRWMHQTIYRTGPSDDSLGFGREGGIVREGTWTVRDSQVIISHRVIYRHTSILGETLPGQIQVDTFAVMRDTTSILLKSPKYGFMRTEDIDERTKRLLTPVRGQ